MIAKQNIFANLPDATTNEQFEILLQKPNLIIERITSRGQITPADDWYNQDHDEWVLLLQGEAALAFRKPDERLSLTAGDYVFIPAHRQHRVTETSTSPECIWLAIHG